MSEVSQIIEGLLDYIEEWTFEDTGNGERNYCSGCGASYSVGVVPKEHKPGCEKKALIERAEAFARGSQ